MKYGRDVDCGDSHRLIDVVEIPDPIPNGLETTERWLSIQFPTLGGFFVVQDWNLSGDVRNEDGSYGNPPPSLPVES